MKFTIVRDPRNLMDKASDSFLRAIKRECASQDVPFQISSTIPKSDEPTIVLQPSDIHHRHYNDVEDKATARVIYRMIRKFDNARCAVIGHGKTVGQPLMELLMSDTTYNNMNVELIKSSTPNDIRSRSIRRADIVVIATPPNVAIPEDLSSKMVIDPAGSYDFNIAKSYISRGQIGKLTTMEIVSRAKDELDG